MKMNKKESLLLLAGAAIGTLAYNALKPIRSKPIAVAPFDIKRYLGKWYEIARIDFFWEKGLSQVTAEYALNSDQSIQVRNSGYKDTAGQWKTAIGKAKFAGEKNVGNLKVSFFGPFYNGYHVVRLTDDYRYALIFGDNLDYLWILSRDTTIPDNIKSDFLSYAVESGYDLNKLVWTKH